MLDPNCQISPAAPGVPALSHSLTVPAAIGRRVFVDLSDTIFHAIWHDTCSGIIRVQLAVAQWLCAHQPDVRPFALHHETFIDLRAFVDGDDDVDTVFARLIKTFRYRGERTTRRRPASYLHYVRRRMRPRQPKIRLAPTFSRNDSLYIGGAFWVDANSIVLAERMIAAGGALHVLLHDLIPLTHPDFTGHDFRQAYLDMLRLPARFIVTNALTKRHLGEARWKFHELEETRCVIVPLADEFPRARRGELPKNGSPRLERLQAHSFVLCVGTVEVRKNHALLLRAWRSLLAERSDLPVLVVAGRKGWKAAKTIAALEGSSLERDRILFVEAPTDAELGWLYAACLFTVFPSFFEGWGLPIGESFWFGKPCAASSDGSLAPVARGLCDTFSPYDPAELQSAILALLDPGHRRARAAAIARTALRSWDDVGRDIGVILSEPALMEMRT